MKRSIKRNGFAHSIRGVGMIEILITVLVLSVGLLGVAALQGFSLKGNQTAHYRTVATNITYEILDHMRVNRRHVLDGTLPGEAHWRQRVQTQLPMPDGADADWGLNWSQLPGTPDVVTVTIRWIDDRFDENEDPDWTISITTGI